MYFMENRLDEELTPEKRMMNEILDYDAYKSGEDSTTWKDLAEKLTLQKQEADKQKMNLALAGIPDDATRGAISSLRWRADKEMRGAEKEASFISSDATDAISEGYPELDNEEMVDTNMSDITLRQPGAAMKQMKAAMFDNTSLMRSTDAILDSLERWTHRDDTQLNPDEATELAREMGADVKFDKPVTAFHARQSAVKYLEKKGIEENMALFDSYLPNKKSLWDNTVLFAAGAAGGFDALEMTATTALSLALPAAALSGIGKGASIVSNALKVKKVENAIRKAKTAKTQFDIWRAVGTEATGIEGVTADMTMQDAALVFQSLDGVKNAPKYMQDYLKAQNALSKLQGLKYDSFTGLGKLPMDAATFIGVDSQFIRANRANSKELGVDLYTEKDASMDMLWAGALGVLLPAGLRAVGSKMGMSPVELRARRIRNTRGNIETDMALGKVTKEEGDQMLKALDYVESIDKNKAAGFKKQHSSIAKAADDLERVNTTSETLLAQKMFLLQELSTGNVPRLHLIPSFESLFSNIHANVIGRLASESAEEVFGTSLITDVTTRGMAKVKVNGENGLLGKAPVTGLSRVEANELIGDLYRGLVLRDAEALERFNTKNSQIQSFSAFLREGLNKGKGRWKIDPVTLSDMESRYMMTRLVGDDLDEYLEHIKQAKAVDAMYGDFLPMPEKFQGVQQEFREFVDTWFKPRKDKDGTVYYYPVNAAKKMDKGRALVEYLDRLDEGLADNERLAMSDDFLQEYRYNKEALQEAVDSLSARGDVATNEDMNTLFGRQRITQEEFNAQSATNRRWSGERSLRMLDYKKAMQDPELGKAMSLLENYSSGSREMGSWISDRMKFISDIDDLRTNQYAEIRESLQKALTTDEDIAKITAAITSDVGADTARALRLAVRALIRHTLEGNEILRKSVAGADRDEFIDYAVKAFEAEVQDKDAMLNSLMSPEKATARALEEDKVPDIGAQAALIEPVILGVDTSLARMQVQAINDVMVSAGKLDLMMKYPEVAAEILTGAATQTIYAFKGAARSVEYASQTYGAYAKGLEYMLRNEHSSTKGQTLFDYYSARENWPDIQEALIRLKHGEDIQSNTDAVRVAQQILSQEATVTDSLKRYGSNFSMPGIHIKKDQLQFIDAVISDEMLEDAYSSIHVKTEGTNISDKVQSFLHDLAFIENEADRKLAFLAFRDFDLDSMFNKSGIQPMSLNRVRDILISGNLADLTKEEIEKVGKATTFLKNKLLGTGYKKGNVVRPQANGWIYRYKAGIHDLGAVMSGKKSFAADRYDGAIHFKNADAEVWAARHFGFKSAQESYAYNFSQMFNAKYSLEQFGSNPIAIAQDLINTYNQSILLDPATAKKMQAIMDARGDNKTIKEKLAISEGAVQSVMENIKLACGLQNATPSTAARWVRTLMRITTSGLLAKAGLKSFADMSTINEGLLLNSFASGRVEAAATIGKCAKMLATDKEAMKLLMASNLVHQEELSRMMANDPGFSLAGVSKNASLLDKTEAVTNKIANTVLNTIGRMEWATNFTKSTAALSIQYSIGKNAKTAFKELPENFQTALLREGLEAEDWDFIRTHAVTTVDDYMESLGEAGKFGDTDQWFIPQKLYNIPDEVFEKELKTVRGEVNVTKAEVENFKLNMLSKAWTLVETGASQFTSLPSGRQMVMLRGGAPRNSGRALLWELATQYQSFGVSMVYNTFGRRLANGVARETGISIMDLFNPWVQLKNQKRRDVLGGVFASWMSVAMATMLVDNTIKLMAGQATLPVDENGEWHLEPIMEAGFNAAGIFGTLGDAVMEGILGSGLHGGGFSIQIAPALANPIRQLYRVGKTLRSNRIDNKAGALAAASINELARSAGVYSGPIYAPIWQTLIGAYLDAQAVGGEEQYQQYLRNRESRGRVTMPWEQEPVPIWERLQN